MIDPRRRRARLWAGLYAGLFGVDDADDAAGDGAAADSRAGASDRPER